MTRLRDEFVGPFTVTARYFDRNGLYITDSGYNTQDMVAGPMQSAALVIDDCKDLCIANSACHSIAYPGCYLLSRKIVDLPFMATTALQYTGHTTATFVKKYMEAKVEGIAGYPGVYTFQGEDSQLNQAYLNRPSSCVVNSKGDLVFADVWNQRIRSISGHLNDCLYSAPGVTDTEEQEYVGAINNATTACNATEGGMAELFRTLQEQVVESRNTTLLEAKLCEYGDSPDPSYLQAYTQNVLVLCDICAEVDPRPAVCPPVSMCSCRNALVQVLKQAVYQKCEGPQAYFDVRHRWFSAYVVCYRRKPEDASWLTNGAMRLSLKQRLQAYTR